MAAEQSDENDLIEGIEPSLDLWDYPLDSVSVRTETRTIHEVVTRRIAKGFYIMDPDFQRDFVWDEARQSRLVESVLMRIPLPVFYLAENPDGKLVVVDGLQRLTTFQRFLDDSLKLQLDKSDLLNKKFSELPPKLQNRIEDTQITLYIIDSKVPDRARLDIFERVNGGVALSRQQMRNALYQGKATSLLKELAQHPTFRQATGGSLQPKTMRDREAINRFCAFALRGPNHYHDDMDQFLGDVLAQINQMTNAEVEEINASFLRSMRNNLAVFGKHAFRKHARDQEARSILNMSLFDVFSTGLAPYDETRVDSHKEQLREHFFLLMTQGEFIKDITYGTNGRARVVGRFQATKKLLEEVLGAV
jgi:hypothetical protein